MAFKNMAARTKQGGNAFSAIKQALENHSLSAMSGCESLESFKSQLGSVAGGESLTLQKIIGDMKPSQFAAFQGALGREETPAAELAQFEETARILSTMQGMEGFSLQNKRGSEQELKTANLTLNAQSHLQTPAAEALFTSLTVAYEDEGVTMKVRAAGLGVYAYGNSAWQSASELRPIFGLLRSGDMYKDDVLSLYPVYPSNPDSENMSLFVPESLIAPKDANYPEHDGFGRDNHKTQFLKVPSTIPNFLGLCQAPGQRPWTSTDEVESNSIQAKTLAVTAVLEGKAVSFFIPTAAMSNNTFGPTTTGQSSDDRQLNMHLRLLPGFSVLDKDGLEVGEKLFAAFKAAGYEPLLNVSFSGNFQRQSNEMRLNSGTAEVYALRDLSTGEDVSLGKATVQQKALIRTLADGVVKGVELTSNATNISRGNFGYRIEVFDSEKRLSVRRNSPVSVKYPITKEDTNQDALDFAIQQMSVVINNQCSKKAFEVAQEHLKYITSIDGAPVAGNVQGSNVLAGQHYVSATAVNREMSLRETVSVPSNLEVFDAVTCALLNEISDITAALNTKSGLAAIAEYGGADTPEWTVVIHQNLSRFLMRTGDARTLGPKIAMDIKETNFDSQIGQLLIVPKNTSTSEFINPLGGVGVCISKENIVVQGNVTRENQEYGVVMTMPTYRHWALCPIIGSLVITDAKEFLGDEGLLTKLAKQKVDVIGLGDKMDALIAATKDAGAATPNP